MLLLQGTLEYRSYVPLATDLNWIRTARWILLITFLEHLALGKYLIIITYYSQLSVSVGSSPADTEDWLYYAILYKELEHP